MSRRATSEAVQQFKEDRELLNYTDAEIGRRMGIDRSNFSSYINGNLPITKDFIRRFYYAFLNEVLTIKREREEVAAPDLLQRVERLEEVVEQLKQQLAHYVYQREG